MRKLIAYLFLIVSILLFSLTSSGQEQNKSEVKLADPVRVNFKALGMKDAAHDFDRYIPAKKSENENTGREMRNLPVPPNAIGKNFKAKNAAKPKNPSGNAPLLNTEPQLITRFEAISDNNKSIPPDCAGAVGPDHVMTALNTYVRIQTKTGATAAAYLLLDEFFGALKIDSTFDPRIAYDRFQKRWVVAAVAKSNSANSSLVIAVSESADPTEYWKEYKLPVEPSHKFWLDYPMIGINKSWLVVSGNLWTIEKDPSKSKFTNALVYAFDKQKLLDGNLATAARFDVESDLGSFIVPAETLDEKQDVEYFINNYNGNKAGNGFLHILKLSGDVVKPKLESTRLYPNVDTPWNIVPDDKGEDFGPQKGTANRIQNNDARVQNLVFQKDHLWCTQTVFLPLPKSSRAAIQWWEIDPANAEVLQFGRIDDAKGEMFYAFPSIAVNNSTDVMIGYSSFSSDQYGSSCYSFHSHSDPSNSMQQTVIFKAGENKYYKTLNGNRNRWGDYGTTCLDPDGISFWSLGQSAAEPGVHDAWDTYWVCIRP